MSRPHFGPREAALAKRLRIEYPQLYQHEIAALLRTNQGRISETFSGKRWTKVPPADPSDISGLMQ